MSLHKENEKLSPRALQAEQTKNRIFNVATQLITKKGYENVSIADICKEAKCSVGSFYHYFSSKDEILMAAYREADVRESQMLEENPPKGDFIEKIIHIFNIQSAIAQELGVEFMTQMYRNQIVTKNNYLFSESRIIPHYLREIILEGQDSGEITGDYSVDFLVNELMKFSRGLFYDWCSHQGRYDYSQSQQASIQFFLRSFTR